MRKRRKNKKGESFDLATEIAQRPPSEAYQGIKREIRKLRKLIRNF